MAISLIALTTWNGIVPTAADHFVSTKGSDGATGAANDPWRTIDYAQAQLSAGDTLWIKAGKYAETIVLDTNGSSGNLISYLGYREHPGDAADICSTATNETAVDATVLPLLDGLDRTTAGNVLTFSSRSYIAIKNLQVTGKEIGIYGSASSYCTLENLFVRDMGDQSLSYKGKGIMLIHDADYNVMTNCCVVNCCAENFAIWGSYNTISGCRSFCDDELNAYSSTDYYFYLWGDNAPYRSDYNTITDCYMERVGNPNDYGHGFEAKGSCTYNTFTRCTAVNTGGVSSARGGESQYNSWVDCTAIDTKVASCSFSDGASNNTVTRLTATNSSTNWGHIEFGPDRTTETPDGYLASNNHVEDSAFSGATACFFFSHFSGNISTSEAHGNTVDNCTFDDCDYMFDVRSGPNGVTAPNEITSSTFSNIATYARYYNATDISDIGTTHGTEAGNVNGGGLGFDLDSPP